MVFPRICAVGPPLTKAGSSSSYRCSLLLKNDKNAGTECQGPILRAGRRRRAGEGRAQPFTPQRHLCPGCRDAEGELVGCHKCDGVAVDLTGRVRAGEQGDAQGPDGLDHAVAEPVLWPGANQIPCPGKRFTVLDEFTIPDILAESADVGRRYAGRLALD